MILWLGLGAALLAAAGLARLTHADPPPAGLVARANVGAYLDGHLLPANPFPLLLSETGAFTDTPARIPHAGLVPYILNSPLWTDAAIKERFIALPYDGTAMSPTIGFSATGPWTFPAGTVIVKNFDMQMDEQGNAPSTIRRLETRILVIDGNTARGATYKWRNDYSDADLIPESLTAPQRTETLNIIGADGAPRQQPYSYPSPAECLQCHNAGLDDAGKPVLVLGVKTTQLNGNVLYTATGITDNQLNTWEHLGMLDQTLAFDLSVYGKMVDVSDTSATLEYRFRSYIAANCSHCHRPGGLGPKYDMRIETPLLSPAAPYQSIIAARGSLTGGLIRDNLAGSSLFARDSAPPGGIPGPMPPLARNVPDLRIIGAGALYDQWVNYPFDLQAITPVSPTQLRLQFDRPLDAVSAATASNYAIDGGAGITQASVGMGAEANIVTLTTTPLANGTGYVVTVNGVRELAAPQNPVWPNTRLGFVTNSVPSAPSIGVTAGNGQVTINIVPSADGGSPITGYAASCTLNADTFTASGATTMLTVTGLTNGSTYACTARAINAIGQGPDAVAVNVTPFTVPDAPTGVTAIPGDGSATISFTAPANNGAAITGYQVTCGMVTATGTATTIVVTGLTNEVAYACSVTASNAAGAGVASDTVNVTPTPPPQLIKALSTKVHGGAGPFELEINRDAPSIGPLTVESRAIGAGHRILFQFDRTINQPGTVTVVDSEGSPIGVATRSALNDTVIVTLTDVPDNRRVTILLSGVNGAGTASVTLGFLVGDINQSRSVNAADILVVKVRAGPATGDSYMLDFNASGLVDRADLSMARARSGLVLP